VPTFALITHGGSVFGGYDLDEDEATGGVVIRCDGLPPLRVVGGLDLEQLDLDPGVDRLPVLLVERV
jgi:hypothetical protein